MDSTPKYDFVDPKSQTDTSDDHYTKPQSLRQRFGHIPVVTASFNLLFRFLANQIYWYSVQTGGENQSTIDWARALSTGNPSPLYKRYNTVFETIAGATTEFPHSGTVKMTCVYRDLEGKFFLKFIFGENEVSRKFLESKGLTFEQFMEQNGMTLGESNPTHILHQMTQRLNSLAGRLEKAATCDYDITAVETLKTAQDYFYQLFQEAKLHMSQFKRVTGNGNTFVKRSNVESHRTQQDNRGTANVISNTHTKKSERPPTKKNAPAGALTPPVNTPPATPKSPSTFVSNQISYSAMTSGQKTASADRTENMFAVLADDATMVDPDSTVVPAAPVNTPVETIPVPPTKTPKSQKKKAIQNTSKLVTIYVMREEDSMMVPKKVSKE